MSTNATLVSATTRAEELASACNTHILDGSSAASQHDTADYDNLVDSAATIDLVELQNHVNDLADHIYAHTQNIKWSDKSSVAYHPIQDKGSAVDVERASDLDSTVRVVENSLVSLARHVDNSGSTKWHEIVWSGYNDMSAKGIIGLQKLFLENLQDSDPTDTDNGLQSIKTLIAYSGFTKA